VGESNVSVLQVFIVQNSEFVSDVRLESLKGSIDRRRGIESKIYEMRVIEMHLRELEEKLRKFLS